MAINNLGNVAYTLSDGSGNPGSEMAYFYNKSGKTAVSCGSLYPGYPISDAFGINDNNIVVGDYYNANMTLSAMAWKWNGATGGTMVDLGAVSGGFGTDANNYQEAYSINNSNQVTGYACTSPLVDGNGNGYPTPYVANVTNAFGGSPSITYNWLRTRQGARQRRRRRDFDQFQRGCGDRGRGTGRNAKRRLQRRGGG